MLDISKQAIQQLKEFKERQGENTSVRIGVLSGQLSGPNLGVTTDVVNENDEIFQFDGLEVIVDKGLLTFCKTIEVQFVLQEGGGCGSGGGFKIIPQIPL